MEPQGSLLCSRETATGHADLDAASPQLSSLFP